MAWSRLQSNSTSGGNVTTLSAAYTSNLTAGSTMIALATVAFNGSIRTVSSIKDGGGNSFIQIAAVQNSAGLPAGVDLELWALNTPAGDAGTTPTITATYSGSNGGTGILIQEVSGLATGATAAALADGTAGTTTGTATGNIGPPGYTSSAANEYLVYAYGDSGSSTTWTVPAGYTSDPKGINTSGNSDLQIAYKNSTGSGETGHYSLSGGSPHWALLLVAFNLPAAAAAGPVPYLSQNSGMF